VIAQLVGCPDVPDVARTILASVLAGPGAHIKRLSQYSSAPLCEELIGRFFLRAEVEVSQDDFPRLGGELEQLAAPLGLDYGLYDVTVRRRVALLVSRYDHCLLDLLARSRDGELACDITAVISNHPDLADAVARFGVPFRHVPASPDGNAATERELLDAIGEDCELIVLARYMQILSGDFLARAPAPAINIHHSFLPAFAGASPYERARERGVKLIGATAHYVTEELDAGPIIEQDVARVSHLEEADGLTRIGRDIERLVLARAVRWHLDDRVLRYDNRTIIL
jgi:formyltetrahydrofolate deformylase